MRFRKDFSSKRKQTKRIAGFESNGKTFIWMHAL